MPTPVAPAPLVASLPPNAAGMAGIKSFGGATGLSEAVTIVYFGCGEERIFRTGPPAQAVCVWRRGSRLRPAEPFWMGQLPEYSRGRAMTALTAGEWTQSTHTLPVLSQL